MYYAVHSVLEVCLYSELYVRVVSTHGSLLMGDTVVVQLTCRDYKWFCRDGVRYFIEHCASHGYVHWLLVNGYLVCLR